MSITSELKKSRSTKRAIEYAMTKQGVPPTGLPFCDWPALVSQIGGDATALQTKTAIPAATDVEVTPDDGIAGLLKVLIEADINHKPYNIMDGITIHGVTGTAKPYVVPGDSTWPFPSTDIEPGPHDPPTEEEVDNAVKEDDPEVNTEDKMVLAQNDGNITVGYLYGDDFEITYYDPVTTEFKAVGWRRVSKHTTGENAGKITRDNFTRVESGGWNYLKNIRSCTREKLYYKGVEVWPNNLYVAQYSYNGTVLPALPEHDTETYHVGGIVAPTDEGGQYMLFLSRGAYPTSLNDGKVAFGVLLVPALRYTCVDGVWSNPSDSGFNTQEFPTERVLWTPIDITDDSGSIVFYGSAPIPV